MIFQINYLFICVAHLSRKAGCRQCENNDSLCNNRDRVTSKKVAFPRVVEFRRGSSRFICTRGEEIPVPPGNAYVSSNLDANLRQMEPERRQDSDYLFIKTGFTRVLTSSECRTRESRNQFRLNADSSQYPREGRHEQ